MGKTRKNGVSIITSTIRPFYKNNVFKNYARQKWQSKELIIILNRDDMNIAAYKKRAKKYPNVRVFQMSRRYSLGECLNYAVKRAKYNYIAKFDDDDYYTTNYIPEAMHMFKNSKADIVGKPSFFFYFPHRKILLLRRKSVRPFKICSKIAGATIMFHKKVFRHVKFVRTAAGTDALFLSACRKKGYTMYSTSSYNFAAFRRVNHNSHTWKISAKKLLAEKNTRIIRTKFFKNYVNRPVGKLKI